MGNGGGPATGSAAGVSSTPSLRLRRYHELLQKRNRNPIYDCPEFAQYRLKQKDKDRQVWPDVLENAFLDGEYDFFSIATLFCVVFAGVVVLPKG